MPWRVGGGKIPIRALQQYWPDCSRPALCQEGPLTVTCQVWEVISADKQGEAGDDHVLARFTSEPVMMRKISRWLHMGSLREVWLPRMLTLQQFWPDCRLALPGLKTDSTFRNSCSCGSYGAARSTDSQLVLATLRWEHHSLGRGLVGHSSAVPHPGYTGMRYNGAGLSPNTLTNQTSFLLVLY